MDDAEFRGHVRDMQEYIHNGDIYQGMPARMFTADCPAALAACPRTIVLRTAWVFGEHGNNFVKTMLRLGRERDTLGIVADQFGAPTYAGDIAAALIQIARHIAAGQPVEYGVYHFSGSPYTSWHGFAGEIFRRAADPL